jgi:hypothetical protein
MAALILAVGWLALLAAATHGSLDDMIALRRLPLDLDVAGLGAPVSGSRGPALARATAVLRLLAVGGVLVLAGHAVLGGLPRGAGGRASLAPWRRASAGRLARWRARRPEVPPLAGMLATRQVDGWAPGGDTARE